MKRSFIWISGLAVALGTGLILGQGSTERGYTRWAYDLRKAPPPLTLTKAYAAALAKLGDATNRFFCISASCPPASDTGTVATEWAFVFMNTNGQQARLSVLFYNPVIDVDGQSASVLWPK